MDSGEYIELLKKKDLKVTPQRIAVLEAIFQLNNHPTADNIKVYLQDHHPTIALGTIYNILDVLLSHGIIRKVYTGEGSMRYDPITEPHHHLYCMECDQIEDFYDHELDQILKDYFNKKKVKDFEIRTIKLQISGIFLHKK